MSLTIPVVSSTVGPLYATQLNAAISNNGGDIDSHDHSPGKGKLVNVDGIGINGNLPFAGFSATQLGSLTFLNQTVPMSLNTLSLDANGNLFVNDNAGNSIQMTQAGAALGGSAANGITGAGYGSGGVTISWVSGSKAYQLLQAATAYALLQTGPIHLFDTAAGLSNSVNLLSPVSLTNSYSLLFHAPLPTRGGIFSFSVAGSTGTMCFSVIKSTLGQAFVVVGTDGTPAVAPASLPPSKGVVTIDASGSIGASNVGTGTGLSFSNGSPGGFLGITAGGVTQAMRVALTSGSPSAGSGTFTNNATNSYTTAITTGTIATTGRWVTVVLQPTSASPAEPLEAVSRRRRLQIVRDGSTVISVWSVAQTGELEKASPSSTPGSPRLEPTPTRYSARTAEAARRRCST